MSEDNNMDFVKLSKKIGILKKELKIERGELKKLFARVIEKRKEAERIQNKRDEHNKEAKEKGIVVNALKEKRDKTNQNIAKLKKERNEALKRLNEIRELNKDLKRERDELNLEAKGSTEFLSDVIRETIEKLENANLPVDVEIKLFENLDPLSERLEKSKKSDGLHGKIVEKSSGYKEIKELADRNHKERLKLFRISKEAHTVFIERLKELEQVRDEGSEKHKELLQIYREITRIQKGINEKKSLCDEKQQKLNEIEEKIKELMKGEKKVKAGRRLKKAQRKVEKGQKMGLGDLGALLGAGVFKKEK